MAQQTPQVDDNGFPEYEPVRVYDAPATILTQILDGEGSLSRAIRTLMEQESLSPAERDSYATRLKKAYGGNAIMDTTIDLATNPLVWLTFLVSPIGAREFVKTRGKLLAGLAEQRQSTHWANRAFAHVAELFRPLQATPLIGQTETQAPARLYQAWQARLQKLRTEEAELIGTARGNLAKKLNVEDLDPSRHPTNKLIHQVDRLAYMVSAGHIKPGTMNYPEFFDTVTARAKVLEPGAAAAVEKGLILSAEEIAALKEANAFRAGGTVTVGGRTIELVHNPVTLTKEEDFKRARSFFDTEAEKNAVKYTQVRNRDQHIFNIDALNEELVRDWARKHGIEKEFFAYTDKVKEVNQHFKKRMFGKLNPDGSVPEKFDLDTRKVLRVYLAEQRTRGNKEYSAEHAAMRELLGPEFFETIDRILPAHVKKAIKTGNFRTSVKDVEEVLSAYLTPQLTGEYLSRNTPTIYTVSKDGVLVTKGPTHADALSRRREVIKTEEVPNIMLPRRGNEIVFDKDDLGTLRDVIAEMRGPEAANNAIVTRANGDTFKLPDYIESTRAILKAGALDRGSATALSMSHELSMRKYLNDAHSTIALHSMEVPESVMAEVRNAIRASVRQLPGAEKVVDTLSPTDLRRLEDMGVAPEHIKYLSSVGYLLPETLEAAPGVTRLRDKLNEVELGLSTETDPARIARLEAKRNRIAKRIDRIGARSARPDVALLNPEDRTVLSMSDALNIVLARESIETQEFFSKGIIPAMYGGAKPPQIFGLRSQQQARGVARRFGESPMADWLHANGGTIGRDFIQAVRQYGSSTGYEMDAAYRSGGLTGYLYATHLGFNAASAVWNALQPFQWASTWMGGREVLGAYGTALKQLGGYLTERVTKHGFGPLDPKTQMELFRKHVRTANYMGRDLLDMGPDVLSTFDNHMFSVRPQGKPSMLRYLTIDAPLKLFQTAEALNRIVVAEAGLSWYDRMQKTTGLRLAPNEMLDEVKLMQSMVNFSHNPVTQLRIFQQGGLLENPMLRMFLQYPSRSIANVALSQQLGGGTRRFGVGEFAMDIPAFIGDTARLAGTSAVLYEIGKNMLGLDISSGLGLSAITQLPTGGVPVPPVIDIPAKLIHSMYTQDRDEFRQAAFRLLPGGIALQKALGALPALPGGGDFGIIQSQYADWGNRNEQGMVPVYKNDGTLQGFESPLSLVMRGIGADFKKHKSPQEATKFLLANRAEMIDLRRKYKDAVLGNNFVAAQSIEAEYKKRYGVPMTVKPSEWENAINLRETSVGERLLDTMNADVRGVYQQALSGPTYAAAMGLPVGGLEQGETSRQRGSIRGFNVDVVSPDGEQR